MTTEARPWQIAELLPRFYEKNALSIAGKESHFKIVKFKFGHDPALIDESTKPPTLKNFNAEDNDIKNVFHEGTFDKDDIIFSNGRLMYRCVMPENTLTEPAQYSQTGLYDANDNLIAISIDLPDWLTPEEGVTTHPYINFPIA